MNKNEFLSELRSSLKGLPEKDIKNTLDYYCEMADERIEGGMTEEEAIAELGTPCDIARETMLDMSLPKLIKTKYKKDRWKAWEIIALIIGSPIWLSFAAAILAVVISVYAVIGSLIVSIWAIEISFFGVCAAGIIVCIFSLARSPLSALLYLGMGLAAAGLTLLGFLACLKLTVLFGRISVLILKFVKSLFIGRRYKNEEIG